MGDDYEAYFDVWITFIEIKRKSFFLMRTVLAVGHQLTQMLPQIRPISMPIHRIHFFLWFFINNTINGQFKGITDKPGKELSKKRTGALQAWILVDLYKPYFIISINDEI